MAYCKICQTTDATLFYASIKTYCKEHWKEKVRANRVANIEHYRSFDKMRASMPHRVSARKEYQKSDAGKIRHAVACANWIKKNPARRLAHNELSSALHAGKIQKLPCLVCGSDEVEAHHPDYSRPLDVVWLCEDHHKEIHWHMGELVERHNIPLYQKDQP